MQTIRRTYFHPLANYPAAPRRPRPTSPAPWPGRSSSKIQVFCVEVLAAVEVLATVVIAIREQCHNGFGSVSSIRCKKRPWLTALRLPNAAVTKAVRSMPKRTREAAAEMGNSITSD